MGLLTLCAHTLPCRYCRAQRSKRAACLLHLWHSSGLSTAQRRLNFAANALRTTLIVQAVCLRGIPCCRDGTRKLLNLVPRAVCLMRQPPGRQRGQTLPYLNHSFDAVSVSKLLRLHIQIAFALHFHSVVYAEEAGLLWAALVHGKQITLITPMSLPGSTSHCVPLPNNRARTLSGAPKALPGTSFAAPMRPSRPLGHRARRAPAARRAWPARQRPRTPPGRACAGP